jgi:hypothetical protein
MADEAEELRRRELVARKNAPPLGGLFEIQHPAPSVPNAASETAADRLQFTKAGRASRASQNLQLLRLICSRDSGYTRDELDAETGYGAPSICARVKWDLMPLYVMEADAFRKTRKGINAKVLLPTDAGRKRIAGAA